MGRLWGALTLTSLALTLTVACGSDDKKDNSGASSGGSGGSAGSGGGTSIPDPDPAVAWNNLECDALVPEYCAYPFPNNVFTVDDASTPTGRRLSLTGDFLPTATAGPKLRGEPWDDSDGFSAGAAMLAYFPGVTMEGLATSDTIAESLEADSPTIILNAETGERIPHWVDIDKSAPADQNPSFMLRPAVRLDDNTRYIVAMRNLQGAEGPIEPSAGFRALRDKVLSDDSSIEDRRPLFVDIFQHLDGAGVAREDLVLAWDFTTASQENNQKWMLSIRDQTYAWGDDNGLEYTIDEVTPDFKQEESNGAIAFKIDGTFKMPMFVDRDEPGASLVFDDDGNPTQNGDMTLDVPFTMMIPTSALTTPAPIVQYGHGLLGDRSEIVITTHLTLANEFNYILFSVDLQGFSEDDEEHITAILGSGQMDNLRTMFERMHQGTANMLLALRVIRDSFSQDATYGQYIDPSQTFYYGISQGGIFGPVYMALSPDVERGVFGVMGQPYNLLLNRSKDFEPFVVVLRVQYPDSRDQQLLLSLYQSLWDRMEPSGYTNHVTRDNLPGVSPKTVLLRNALGDHQVTTLGSHVMARSLGAVHLDSGIRDIYGLEKTATSTTSSALIEYDFGLPKEPLCNRPMSLCDDPHERTRRTEAARTQLDHFFQTGEIRNFCENETCVFPDLGNCSGEEDPAAICSAP